MDKKTNSLILIPLFVANMGKQKWFQFSSRLFPRLQWAMGNGWLNPLNCFKKVPYIDITISDLPAFNWNESKGFKQLIQT